MIAAATKVNSDLTADNALQAVVSGKHFWELAPDKTEAPLIVYRLSENKRPTKDQSGDYDVRVLCFDKTLTKSAELSELVKDALSNNYRYRGAASGYTDDEAREGYIELNFNFKIQL